MSVAYRAVQWNRHKRLYDGAIVIGCAVYLAAFMLVGAAVFRPPNEVSAPVLLMRALGSLAIVLLHVILLIGPLARFDARFAPLLYNRRHLGVSFFLVALAHGAVVTGYYGAFGGRNPLGAVLSSGGSFLSVSGFPFELLGFAALLIFFLMAATSHDFWLKNLSPRWWKRLHMLVYAAYALVVLHVLLGALQSERSALYPTLLGLGAAAVGAAHVAAGRREARRDATHAPDGPDEWLDVCATDEIRDGRARIVCPRDGERIAVFRRGDAYSAVANVCAHQGGPLGEGRIIDGCITCPWHGYQYLPESGSSPPPFTEKIPTYRVRVADGRVQVHPRALPPGTAVEPARAAATSAEARA